MAAENATAPQADLPVVEIGTRIRFTRRLRSLTLKEVATATGCSESLLSKIENGHASPSLKMLQRLTHALGLTVGQLFAQEAHPDHIVMRAATRVAFDTEDGGKSRVEPLAPHSGGHLLECHLHYYAPGCDSGGDLQHEGEEFGYVLDGEIELTVAGRRYTASAGDSFLFRSERPHSFRNKGTREARVVWINTPPTF
ncbi:transcriptional regulator with XRE-family HTH domain [Nitrobacteraceae bacterium AZCC 2161]|jgi:transcriptional regulator with XRE-family HTH domain